MNASEWVPSVDVVMSTLNEERFVGRCLDAVLEQDYPRERVRVWLVDGGSSDRTVAIARARSDRDPRLAVIADGRRRSLPEALNLALSLSSSELVAKVDAHGYPERDFLRRAVEAFRSAPHGVACVGGRPEQEGETAVGRAAALARTSRFGVGGSVYAGACEREFVDSVQCGVYRRADLAAVGGFDPEMAYGEDEELNWRLRKAGLRILLDASVRFHYVTRSSWRALFSQYRNYGRARVRVVAAHPDFLRPRHLAPAALVSAASALLATAPVSSRARRGLAASALAYTSAAAAAGTRASRGRGARTAARVAGCFAALHLGYGIGTIEGVATLLARRQARPRASARTR